LGNDSIGRWIVHWQNAGRVVRSDEWDDSVEDVFKVREEIVQEVDAVRRNGN
jgi:hypothetical protein